MMLERFTEMKDFQLALDERGASLHSWHFSSEAIVQVDGNGNQFSWTITVFYALFRRNPTT